MSQYNCPKAEIVKPLLPFHQLAGQVTTQARGKRKSPIDNRVAAALKAALKENTWFQNHANVCLVQNGLAQVRVKLWFCKVFTFDKKTVLGPSLKKDIESYSMWQAALYVLRLNEDRGKLQDFSKL